MHLLLLRRVKIGSKTMFGQHNLSLPLKPAISVMIPLVSASMEAMCVCVCVCARARARAHVCVMCNRGMGRISKVW